jgi:[acyl-carrier-protein] S-malonyltransferase
MAALVGLDLAAVREVCAEASSGGEIAVAANLNAPGQIVISGNAGAVRRALEAAKGRGAGASVELKVSAPFHCPLMQPARDGMATVFERLTIAPLSFGVIANVSAAVNHDAAKVEPLLLEQITGAVRWEESMVTLDTAGIGEAIEFGAGRVLASLMRRINRNLKVRSAEDSASVRAAILALAAGAPD